MIRFFHTADAHFGVENYGKVDQKTGIHSRFLDFVRSFEQCVDAAIAQRVDFFLFCGDAYKTAYPTPTQQKQLLRLFFKLQQAGIPIVSVVGNHDHPLSFGKSHALDVFSAIPLDGLYVLSKPEILTLKTKNGPVQIVGIPWPLRQNVVAKQEHQGKDGHEITSYISERVGQIIKTLADQLDPKIPAVLVAHLTVSTGIFSGSEKCAVFGTDPIFLPSQLALAPFDYVALGHLHRHQNLNPNGYPAIVYSGSLECIDFGERKEKKGFCCVEIDETKKEGPRCEFTFMPVETRPMLQFEIVLNNEKRQTDQIVEKLAEQDLTGAIVKIIYHVPDGANDTVDINAVQRACSLAMHLAGILPVRKPVTHDRRGPVVSVSMDFASLVDKYLTWKGGSDCDVAGLKEKAFALYKEQDEKEELQASGLDANALAQEVKQNREAGL